MRGGVTDAGQPTNSEDRATQPNGSWMLSFAIQVAQKRRIKIVLGQMMKQMLSNIKKKISQPPNRPTNPFYQLQIHRETKIYFTISVKFKIVVIKKLKYCVKNKMICVKYKQ